MKTIQLDFKAINSLETLHHTLKEQMGFPDFYGANIHALIDCLSSIRYPEDGMSKITLEKDEILMIETTQLSQASEVLLRHLLIAVEDVNNRQIARGNQPDIYICLR
ncbi:barstar family protein [Chitinophaga vietnamensis]|uniref:barstar family protein n=1 Tax=Chitinophaga vietnamensis TaxID=2593957 RepID=UPI00117792E0|nr:barstar family protein [Chitinophaga vietnamensis]